MWYMELGMYVHDCTCMYHVIGYILYWDILEMIAVTHDPERNDGGKRRIFLKFGLTFSNINAEPINQSFNASTGAC